MPDTDKLIVLDLDETLIFSTETKLDREPDFTASKYFSYKRPHLNEFLEECFKLFKVGVWTSASEDYAQAVVKNIFKDPSRLEFVWTCARCTQKYSPDYDNYELIKDLKKLKDHGYPIEKIIMVDDSKEKVQRNYGNAIIVKSFIGDPKDDELLALLMFLERIKCVDSVRKVNKMNWRDKPDEEFDKWVEEFSKRWCEEHDGLLKAMQ